MVDIRIGIGHDIHAFSPDRDLWLGGVKVPFDKGLLGHSDADALLHAIMDAMLGALALGDIGKHFPDTDPKYKGISSMALLSRVMDKIRDLGFKVGNVDSHILCQLPKIAPFRDEMRKNISIALNVSINKISVKAGTNEGFDSIGRGEALACQAVVLLQKDI